MCCWPPGLTPDSMLLKASLLLGLIVLMPHICSPSFVDISRRSNYFTLCVEFAVFHFNQVYPDEYAYKLLWVRRSQHKKFTMIYLMELELGQTICAKQDEDLDNCPLQEGPREKKVDCTFIVDVRPWFSQFSLLNSTCVQK
ncbi:probable cystatin-15 [Vulpes vulpes]|uniref:Probable cystatin-15 n=1 Tax=Vulpes vulpes TaxID=9627 RepID=A0A3Q7SCT4_VULVU